MRGVRREQADSSGRLRRDDHVRAIAGQRHVHDDRPAERAGRGAAEPPGPRRRVRPGPRRHPGRGADRDRDDRAVRRQLRVPTGVPRGRAVRPDHRLLLLRPRAYGPGEHVQQPAGRDGRRPVRAPADRHGDRERPGGGQRADHDRAQGAAGRGRGARRPEGRRCRARPPDRRRAGHGHQPDLRSQRHRQPRHQRGRQGVQPAGQRPDAAAGQPGRSRGLPAGVDVQAGHHGGGAGRGQDPRQQGRLAGPAQAAGHERLPGQLRPLRRQAGHHHPGAAGVLQHRLRQPRAGDRGGQAPGAVERSSASTSGTCRTWVARPAGSRTRSTTPSSP